jgi:hypothetical protein
MYVLFFSPPFFASSPQTFPTLIHFYPSLPTPQQTHATLIPDIQVSTNLLSTARESLTGTMASLRDVRAELESLEEEKKKRLEVEKRKKVVGGAGGAGGVGAGGAGTAGGETRIGGTTGTTSGSGQQPILISVPM